MAKPLDERIAAAMSNGARATTVKDLIAELDAAIEQAGVDAKHFEALSISPTVSEADADAAADEASRASRRIHRLSGKRTALADRLEDLLTSERRRAIEAEHAAARVERDQLATDLAEQWPALQAAMVALLVRLKASDARCASVNQRRAFELEALASAEIITRGCTPMYMHPTLLGMFMPSLKEMTLPRFHASEFKPGIHGSSAWPPPEENAAASLNDCFAQMATAYSAKPKP